MIFAILLCGFLVTGLHVEASSKLTNKLVNPFKRYHFDVKQMVFIPGYDRGRVDNKLNRLLGIDSRDSVNRGVLNRLEALENLVKRYQKENNRRFQEMNDFNGTIAFTVSSSTTLTNHNNQKIKYDKVITNTGNAYNKTTGIFTCPYPGTYVFTWSTMSEFHKNSCFAYIYYNGNRMMITFSYEHTNGKHEVASNTMVLSLKEKDHVWIGTTTGTYCYGYPYTGFSGWKV